MDDDGGGAARARAAESDIDDEAPAVGHRFDWDSQDADGGGEPCCTTEEESHTTALGRQGAHGRIKASRCTSSSSDDEEEDEGSVPNLFFSCYLLVSRASPQAKRTYVGFTTDPKKRLRQHNGELAGGACRTTSGRPWQQVCVVYGFTNKVSALQFEWHLTKPHLSKRLRAQLGFSGRNPTERQVKAKLRVLATMLQHSAWSRQPLVVHFVMREYADVFARVQVDPLPAHMALRYGELPAAFDDLTGLLFSESLHLQLNKLTVPPARAACGLCGRVVEEVPVCCLYPDCSGTWAHLMCLAAKFLVTEPNELVPASGECFKCHRPLVWGQVIRIHRLHIAALRVGR